jgi:hypothetical protein
VTGEAARRRSGGMIAAVECMYLVFLYLQVRTVARENKYPRGSAKIGKNFLFSAQQCTLCGRRWDANSE